MNPFIFLCQQVNEYKRLQELYSQGVEYDLQVLITDEVKHQSTEYCVGIYQNGKLIVQMLTTYNAENATEESKRALRDELSKKLLLMLFRQGIHAALQISSQLHALKHVDNGHRSEPASGPSAAAGSQQATR